MFGILFGWRKASKCKKLVKTVQCRLKLLKNKRLCIVNHLREDVAELLKYGHHHTAFDRVEQVIMDESRVQVYDLLYHFCEFIVLNIRYIRKHRDCPNDINEAVSTLIFSSARIGQLPELLSIRKLFGERYGERFVTNAIDLLPGNLVNNQIKENIYIKDVSDDLKYKMLDEIASSFVMPVPLFLEYKPALQEDQQATKGEIELYIGRDAEGKLTYIDSSSDDQYTKTSKEPSLAVGKELILSTPIQNDSDPRMHKLMSSEYSNEMGKLTVSHHYESSSETSAELPEEIVYLDDIEEYVSPHVNKDGNLQDQRLFVFKSFGIRLKEKTDYGIEYANNPEQQTLFQEKRISTKKTKKPSGKTRTRRRSLSQENQNFVDTESATYYYGESAKRSPDNKRQLVISKNISVHESQKPDGFMMRSLEETRVRYDLQLCKYSDTDEREKNGIGESTEIPLIRAMTMPVERPKESNTFTDNINRTKSFPFELSNSSCKHVHPKLPDYDELAAKFMELKRANLQRKQQLNNAS